MRYFFSPKNKFVITLCGREVPFNPLPHNSDFNDPDKEDLKTLWEKEKMHCLLFPVCFYPIKDKSKHVSSIHLCCLQMLGMVQYFVAW